jgi:hypothetical protein
MSFFDSLFGGKPPKYKKVASLYEGGGGKNAQGDFMALRAFLKDRMAGVDLLTDDDLRHMLAPVLARTATDAQSARFQAGQHAIATNANPRSGALARIMNDISMNELDANRQAWGAMKAQQAGVRNSNAMQAAGMSGSMLENDQSFRGSEATKEYNAKAARATASSGLGNFLKFATGVAAEVFTGGLAGKDAIASAKNTAPNLVDTYNASPTRWGGTGSGQPLPSNLGFGNAMPTYTVGTDPIVMQQQSQMGSAFDRAFGTSAAPLYARN